MTRRSPGGIDASPGELATARRLARPVERWFERAGRSFPWRTSSDPYRLAVTEILLQRTRAEVVARFSVEFFERFPDWSTLARAPVPELETLLVPLGLYRRRASVLHRLALIMDGPRDAGTKLPGFGQYVERAVDVATTGGRVAMVDSNFVRIITRVFPPPWMADYRFDRRLQALAQAVVDGARDAKHVNWGMLDLGALICMPRAPSCDTCPIRRSCTYARQE